MSAEHIVVLITVGSSQEADSLSIGLVKEKLAYCVNQIPGLRSTYFWDGEVCIDEEIQLLVKTRIERFDKLEKWVKANHSYGTPEIIALPIVKGSSDYLKCIDDWCLESF
jgi:periplasmic divalent cation tolerance protein|tara:strand:- start:151 stop:480 length:330 start_codon:yes stop_codon:yes gene_type:complete